MYWNFRVMPHRHGNEKFQQHRSHVKSFIKENRKFKLVIIIMMSFFFVLWKKQQNVGCGESATTLTLKLLLGWFFLISEGKAGQCRERQ